VIRLFVSVPVYRIDMGYYHSVRDGSRPINLVSLVEEKI